MSTDRERCEYGDVSKSEMKFKHIESVTEATAYVTATVSEPIPHQELIDVAYDVLRGALKLRRENVATHVASGNDSDGTVEISIGISGYTCTQWHHENKLDEVQDAVLSDMERRLGESDYDWDNISFRVDLGEMHSTHDVSGSELLARLTAPETLPDDL